MPHCDGEGDAHHDDMCENQERLKRGAQMILDSIVSSASRSPDAMKKTCCQLRIAVSARFPALGTAIVGGLIFLRFWIPAVTAPEGFHVIESTVSEPARRAL